VLRPAQPPAFTLLSFVRGNPNPKPELNPVLDVVICEGCRRRASVSVLRAPFFIYFVELAQNDTGFGNLYRFKILALKHFRHHSSSSMSSMLRIALPSLMCPSTASLRMCAHIHIQGRLHGAAPGGVQRTCRLLRGVDKSGRRCQCSGRYRSHKTLKPKPQTLNPKP
jgi:hypothetical protein